MRSLVHLTILLGLFPCLLQAQDTLRVLFIGNSYTYVNNLPQLTADISANTGKVILFDSSTPGGYSYSMHSADANTLAKIRQGGWDAVILQEQSQIPTIDQYRYNDMYPAAFLLSDSIRLYSPCAEIITFMTWGRRFGGQQCINGYCSPVFTDFNHMQDSLRSAYLEVSIGIGAQCAPVGMAWRKALEDTSVILHATDNSHPALNGSYLAALVMYSMIWNTSPLSITYDAGVNPALASRFREIADSTVFHSTYDWNRTVNVPVAGFSYSTVNDTFLFYPTGNLPYGSVCHWDFGDGTVDSITSPAHVFPNFGLYQVELTVERCGTNVTSSVMVNWQSTAIPSLKNPDVIRIHPNPAKDLLVLQLEENATKIDFELIDRTGVARLQGWLYPGENRLDVSTLSPGVYLLKCCGKNVRVVIS